MPTAEQTGPSAELLAMAGLSPRNPARRPDARYCIARELASGTGLPREWADGWVRRALAFLRARQACPTDAGRERLSREFPDIDAAFRLHEGPDKLARGVVEARILAGQCFEEVASACGLSRQAVEAYAALFFDVAGKFHARCFILNNAIGEQHFSGLAEGDADVLLRWAGFVLGLPVLEAMIRYYASGWAVPESLGGSTRAGLEELRAMLLVRVIVLARVLPPEKLHRVRLLDQLVAELEQCIVTWPEGGPTQTAGHDTGPPTSALVQWWASWRELTLAVSKGAGFDQVA
jgi:hypothetical protein